MKSAQAVEAESSVSALETQFMRHVAAARTMAADGTPASRRRAIVWLLQFGYSRARIGRAFGISRQRVHALTSGEFGSGFLDAVDQEREARTRQAAPLFARGLSRGAVSRRLGIGEHELHGMIAAAHRRLEQRDAPRWARTLVQAIEQGKRRVREVREAYRIALIEQVGRAIRESGRTLQDLAAATGLSRSSLYELANDTQRVPWAPSAEFLSQLATALPQLRRLRVLRRSSEG